MCHNVIKLLYSIFWHDGNYKVILLGHGGPSQCTKQQKARGAQNGPAQQRFIQGGAQTATDEATVKEDATEDTTEKDGP